MSQPKIDADLHMHTHYSDGVATAEDLLRAAKTKRLKAIAITDHDLTTGNREGQPLAKKYGLELIPALEITVSWRGYLGHGGGPDIDLLAYFVDLDSPTLKRTETILREGLLERGTRAAQMLRERGFDIRVEDVLTTNPSYPGYLPFIKTLVRLGLADESAAWTLMGEVWDQTGGSPLSASEAIEAIHEMGAVAVLAHPSIVRRQDDGELLAERGFAELVEAGLDGAEVYHYRLDARQREHFKRLAQHYNLVVTGGSDTHLDPKVSERFATEGVDMETVEMLRTKAASMKLKRGA